MLILGDPTTENLTNSPQRKLVEKTEVQNQQSGDPAKLAQLCNWLDFPILQSGFSLEAMRCSGSNQRTRLCKPRASAGFRSPHRRTSTSTNQIRDCACRPEPELTLAQGGGWVYLRRLLSRPPNREKSGNGQHARNRYKYKRVPNCYAEYETLQLLR